MTLTAEWFGQIVVAGRLVGAPHARHVIRGARQRPLDPHLGYSSSAEPAHPSLLLQHSVHRFDDRFALGVPRPACRASQFPSPPATGRVAGPRPPPAPPVSRTAP